MGVGFVPAAVSSRMPLLRFLLPRPALVDMGDAAEHTGRAIGRK